VTEVDFDGLKALREPFPPEKVGKLPKVTCGDCSSKERKCEKHKKAVCPLCKAYVSTSHMHVDFVGHADVTDRLLEVDPLWNWEPLGLTDSGLPAMDGNNGMWIRLTVSGLPRLGYGHAGSKRGGDAVKEIIGDAIRNAAMRFGVALDLWRKDSPSPVADNSQHDEEEPVKPPTPEERIKGLRGQCMVIWRNRGGTPAELADEYTQWSSTPEEPKGRDIATETDPNILYQFQRYLQKQANP
jgi:hypothetical protein